MTPGGIREYPSVHETKCYLPKLARCLEVLQKKSGSTQGQGVKKEEESSLRACVSIPHNKRYRFLLCFSCTEQCVSIHLVVRYQYVQLYGEFCDKCINTYVSWYRHRALYRYFLAFLLWKVSINSKVLACFAGISGLSIDSSSPSPSSSSAALVYFKSKTPQLLRFNSSTTRVSLACNLFSFPNSSSNHRIFE